MQEALDKNTRGSGSVFNPEAILQALFFPRCIFLASRLYHITMVETPTVVQLKQSCVKVV